jgi:hypothetical protein
MAYAFVVSYRAARCLVAVPGASMVHTKALAPKDSARVIASHVTDKLVFVYIFPVSFRQVPPQGPVMKLTCWNVTCGPFSVLLCIFF